MNAGSDPTKGPEDDELRMRVNKPFDLQTPHSLPALHHHLKLPSPSFLSRESLPAPSNPQERLRLPVNRRSCKNQNKQPAKDTSAQRSESHVPHHKGPRRKKVRDCEKFPVCEDVPYRSSHRSHHARQKYALNTRPARAWKDGTNEKNFRLASTTANRIG